MKAVSILERALDTLRDCAARLSQSPTPQETADVESTVRATRRVVNGINRDAAGVDASNSQDYTTRCPCKNIMM